jgi:hypothetical protein
MEPNLKSLQYDDIKHSFNPLVILGMEDDVINPLISKEILDDALSYCNIKEVDSLGHRFPLDIFVNIYNKYVI